MFQPVYFLVQTVGRYDTFNSPAINLTQMETQRKAAKGRTGKQVVEFVIPDEREKSFFRAFGPDDSYEKVCGHFGSQMHPTGARHTRCLSYAIDGIRMFSLGDAAGKDFGGGSLS